MHNHQVTERDECLLAAELDEAGGASADSPAGVVVSQRALPD